MLGDFGKELPEDTHLVHLLDPEIPGLSAPPNQSSFDFVTSEVRAQLGHLSFQKTRGYLDLVTGLRRHSIRDTYNASDAPTARTGFGYHGDSWGASSFKTPLTSITTTSARVGKTDRCASKGWYHSAKCEFVCISSLVRTKEGL